MAETRFRDDKNNNKDATPMAISAAPVSLIGTPVRTRDGRMLGHVDGLIPAEHALGHGWATIANPTVLDAGGPSIPVPLTTLRVEQGIVVFDPVRHFAARAGTWRETDPEPRGAPRPASARRPAPTLP